MSMNEPFKTPEILNIADDLLLQNWSFATRIYWRSVSKSCGYVDASKWLTRNNIVIRKSRKFKNIVNICLSSSCIEALLASHWGLAHTIDGIEIVQRKAYHHYMATWLPEEMWNVLLCLLTHLPIDCRFMASICIYTKHAQHLVSTNHC